MGEITVSMREFEIDVEPVERFDLYFHLPSRGTTRDALVELLAVGVLRRLGDQFLVSPRLDDLLRVVVVRDGSTAPVLDSVRDSVDVLRDPVTALAADGKPGAPTAASGRLDVVLAGATGDDERSMEFDTGTADGTTIAFVVGPVAVQDMALVHDLCGAVRTVVVDGPEPIRRLCDSLLGRMVTTRGFAVCEWAESDALTDRIGASGYAIGRSRHDDGTPEAVA